jgi:hypothetical protein
MRAFAILSPIPELIRFHLSISHRRTRTSRRPLKIAIDFGTRSTAIPLTRIYDSFFLWLSYGFPMAFLWLSYGFSMVFLWFSYGFTLHVKYVPSTTCSRIHSHVEGNIRLGMFDWSNIQSQLMADVGCIEYTIPYL